MKDIHAGTVKRHPQRKRWKRKTKTSATNLIQKFDPTNNDLQEHVMSLSVEDIRAFVILRNDDIDMSEDAVPSEMIKICINLLNSNHLNLE